MRHLSPCFAFLPSASALALAAAPARALLVEADLAAPGDGLLTIDTGSGLAWLDWSYAAGMSVNQVSAQLLPGGALETFRYATNAEVTTFWQNAGIPDVPDITEANLAPVQALIELLGVTFASSLVAAGSVGFTSETLNGLRFEATLADRTPFDGLGQATFNRTVGITDDSQEPSRGHALVRSIPEPGSALLLLAGAGALAVARGRAAR
jgi:hypothetical protein